MRVQYSKIKEVKESYKRQLLGMEGVEGVGVGEDAIIVFIEDATVIEGIPKELEGIPVRTVVSGKFELA